MKSILYSLVLFALTFPAMSDKVTQVPFQLVNNLIIVEATVEGKTGAFILDTGAAHLVLNAKHFSGEATNKKYHGVLGVVHNVESSYTTLLLADLIWKNQSAEILPLSHLLRARGINILGMIGCQLLRKYRMMIDYDQQMIYFWTRKSNPSLLDPSLRVHQMVMRYSGGIPFVEFDNGRQPMKFLLDTGAGINLFSQELYHSNVRKDDVSSAINLGSSNKEIRSFEKSFTRGLLLDGKDIQPMQTVFVNLAEFNKNLIGPSVHGIVGYQFLRHYIVLFDFPSNRIYLWPRSSLILLAGTE